MLDQNSKREDKPVAEQQDVVADLTAEGNAVDAMVSGLHASQWTLPTPAVGWTIAHQIAHLAATYRLAGWRPPIRTHLRPSPPG